MGIEIERHVYCDSCGEAHTDKALESENPRDMAEKDGWLCDIPKSKRRKLVCRALRSRLVLDEVARNVRYLATGDPCPDEEPPEPDDRAPCMSCGAPISDAEHDDNGGRCVDCSGKDAE